MVATHLATYLNETDTNMDKIGTWAAAAGGGVSMAKCLACESQGMMIKVFSFEKGKCAFDQHSNGKKHKAAMKKFSVRSRQLSLTESLAINDADAEIKRKAKVFEIDLTRRLDSHNVSKGIMDCLVDCLKTNLSTPDADKIVKQVQMGRRKSEYLAKYGVAELYLNETIALLQNCDAFSIGFDESEVNKTHECEVLVMISMKETGIEMRHYRTIDLEGTDAATITTTLLEQLTDDKIPWQTKLIAPMTDGCNTMQGCNSGVKKRLAEVVPQLKDLGSCNDHHLSNAAKKGVNIFDSDTQDALVNVYFDIGGAKGKGLKKKKSYEKIAKQKGAHLRALRKFGATRFRSYRICIKPVLHNWNTIFEYYSTLEAKISERQKKLKKYFADQEFLCIMKLEFIMAATKDINEAINYFEEQSNKVHLCRKKMEEILRVQVSKFMKQKVVYVVNDGNVSKKTGQELLDIDTTDKSKFLSRKCVFVGQKCASIMRELELKPDSPQLDEFYKQVFKYHQTVASHLQGYFKTGLTCIELEYMAAFAPENRTKVDTPSQIRHLAVAYSKVMDTISPGSFDDLESELVLYQTDENIDHITTVNYNSYWGQVAELVEGDEEWEVYEVLPRLARALGTPFNSGSPMERVFSRQTDITRDTKRNQMSHETLDSHLQIHFGIESRETRAKCPICQVKQRIKDKGSDAELTEVEKKDVKKTCICHCKYAAVTKEMFDTCAGAASKYTEHGKKVQMEKEEEEEEEEEVPDDKEARKRREALKSELKKRSYFYSPCDIKIYESKSSKRKAVNDSSEEGGKSKKTKHDDPAQETPSSSKTSSNTDQTLKEKSKKTDLLKSFKIPKKGVVKEKDKSSVRKKSAGQ